MVIAGVRVVAQGCLAATEESSAEWVQLTAWSSGIQPRLVSPAHAVERVEGQNTQTQKREHYVGSRVR